jgi:S1/P1 Nuclease
LRSAWGAACFIALSLITVLLLPHQVRAWGPEGHHLIATIATKYLSAEVQQRVAALLAAEPGNLVNIASWGDAQAQLRPETEAWHFANIPDDQPVYDAARDCPNGQCLVAQFERWRKLLSAPDTPASVKSEALKWVVSFVADAHQPLHVACLALPGRRYPTPVLPCGAQPHGDRGADLHEVRFGDLGVTLHHVWDHEMFYGMTGNLTQNAERLSSGITPALQRQWASGTFEDWVNETHKVARDLVYGQLPKGSRIVISPRYEAETRNALDLQLQRAGVRMATVLTAALRPPEAVPPKSDTAPVALPASTSPTTSVAAPMPPASAPNSVPPAAVLPVQPSR